MVSQQLYQIYVTKKINVVIIPHGSISEPEENISKFVKKFVQED